jgi:hypothetical protein
MAGKRGRDAGKGQFISVEKAIALGDRAIVETVKKPKKCK